MIAKGLSGSENLLVSDGIRKGGWERRGQGQPQSEL